MGDSSWLGQPSVDTTVVLTNLLPAIVIYIYIYPGGQLLGKVSLLEKDWTLAWAPELCLFQRLTLKVPERYWSVMIGHNASCDGMPYHGPISYLSLRDLSMLVISQWFDALWFAQCCLFILAAPMCCYVVHLVFLGKTLDVKVRASNCWG